MRGTQCRYDTTWTMRYVRRNMREPLGALGRWEAVRDEDNVSRNQPLCVPRKEGWVKGCSCMQEDVEEA